MRRDASGAGAKTPRSSFNPRACVRRDGRLRQFAYDLGSFNPRACVRRDLATASRIPLSMAFQSTRLREARRAAVVVGDAHLRFQSTRLREARRFHHNSLRDKDFFYEIREPVPPLDSKDTGRVGTM